MLTRNKLRVVKGGCADCGAPDPSWASLNRGILICDDCCSIHRSLGRHISQIKSLKCGYWNPQQLKMVQTLAYSGANNIWEHSLLDPSHGKSGRRKPAANDRVHPNKADFIRSKHQTLAYVYRPGKDDRQLTDGDTSLQLHSSVRTANTETSLRLLSLAANPNYQHPEKGTGPLHVAARAGQALQAELLIVHGADPAMADKNGITPIQHARDAGFLELSRRLDECQYELTDRLAYFLTGRRPDHAAGQRFIVPAPAVPDSQPLQAARSKLQSLPDRLFSELCADVYDEVDRRETDAHWLAQHPASAAIDGQAGSVPFLPVNPDFSSTRNQGRQKLARFTPAEFHALVVDLLSEARRRQLGAAAAAGVCSRQLLEAVGAAEEGDDGEPLYDSVASEDDYATLDQMEQLQTTQSRLEDQRRRQRQSDVSQDTYDPDNGRAGSESSVGHMPSPIHSGIPDRASDGSAVEQNMSVSRLLESNKRLQRSNEDMRQELRLLKDMVSSLFEEKLSLTDDGESKRLSLENSSLRGVGASCSTPRAVSGLPPPPPPSRRSMVPASPSQRPYSMFETANGRTRQRKLSADGDNDDYVSPPARFNNHSTSPLSIATATGASSLPLSGSRSLPPQGTLPSPCGTPSPPVPRPHSPTQDDVIHKTEQVTRRIQRLLSAAQGGRTDHYSSCVQRIHTAVEDMVSIFPPSVSEETRSAVHQLSSCGRQLLAQSAELLQPAVSCAAVGMSSGSCSSSSTAAAAESRVVTQRLIQLAFQVAQAAKRLVTAYQ